MRTAHRPFLSLLLCLALAVNLLAPFASASPMFVEICSGHRMVLVPVDEGGADVSCEACTVCCVGIAPPDAWPAAILVERSVRHDAAAMVHLSVARLPRRTARAPPPFPSA